MNAVTTLAVIAALAAFASASAVLAAMGLGVPFIAAAAAVAVMSGVVVGAVAARLFRPAPPDLSALERVRLLEAQSSALRHDMRGVLTPAMMMGDRLLANEDPKVQRAGAAIVKSVQRATALLGENKRQEMPGAAAEPAEVDQAPR